MGDFAKSLAGVYQLLAEQQTNAPEGQGVMPHVTSTQMREGGGGHDPFMDFIDSVLLDPQQTTWLSDRGSTRAGGGGGGGSFIAAPPGNDLHGRDLSPELVNYQGVETSPAYARLIRAAEIALGDPSISNYAGSDYRSHAEQASLYADHLAGRHPAPVAPPGSSFHEQGEAIDWDSGWLAQHPEVRRFFTNHGVTFDVGGEPWHGHLAQMPHVGAILNPRSPSHAPQPSAAPARPTRYR